MPSATPNQWFAVIGLSALAISLGNTMRSSDALQDMMRQGVELEFIDGNALLPLREGDEAMQARMRETVARGGDVPILLKKNGNLLCSLTVSNGVAQRILQQPAPEGALPTAPLDEQALAKLCGITPEEIHTRIPIRSGEYLDRYIDQFGAMEPQLTGVVTAGADVARAGQPTIDTLPKTR